MFQMSLQLLGYGKFCLLENCAAKLVFKALRSDIVQPLLWALPWLRAQARINYRLSTVCNFSDSSPASDLHTVHTHSRWPCSSADTQILCILQVKTKTLGQCSFTYCAPKQWHSLPFDICQNQSSHAFRTVLKTHPYKQYHKWFQILSSSFCPPPPTPTLSLDSFSVCVCVCVCVCVYVWVHVGVACEEYNIMFIYYFWGLSVHLFDLVKWCAHPCPWDMTL